MKKWKVGLLILMLYMFSISAITPMLAEAGIEIKNLVKAQSPSTTKHVAIPIKIKSISDISAKVNQNAKYVLPKTVVAVMTNGSKKSVAVKWNVSSAGTSKSGTYYYYGTVSGYSKKIKLTLVVNPVKSYKALYSKSIDIDGDQKNDTVQILGSGEGYYYYPYEKYYEEIKVLVKTSSGKQFSFSQYEFGEDLVDAYIVDLNGDKTKEIVFTSFGGGTALYYRAHVYTLNNGKLQYSEINSECDDISIEFLDNYQASVYSSTLDIAYTVSFEYRKDEYEEKGVYTWGYLSDEEQLWGLARGPYYECEDIDNDGIYEIRQTKQLTGIYNADALGHVSVYLKLINGKWTVVDLEVSENDEY
jgi:hypothetical protein